MEALQEAARIDARPRVAFGDDIVYRLDAQRARQRAADLLEPVGTLIEGAGEVVIAPLERPGSDLQMERIAGALARPNFVSLAAADQRLRAVDHAGVLEPAVEVAHSARASSPIEKMLCHQLAATHFAAMRLLQLSEKENLGAQEVARYVAAAARAMAVFQSASLTLQKLKTKGRQHVLVQYQQVNVSDGGQAVVAGTLKRGGRRRGRGRGTK